MPKLTQKQKERIKKDKQINRLFLVGAVLFFIACGWIIYDRTLSDDINWSKKVSRFEGHELSPEQICMYNNKMLLNTSNPFRIGDETYYVCCVQCKYKLLHNLHNSRFSIDPFSHNQVDKAEAHFFIDNSKMGKILYFQTVENYMNYNMLSNKK